MSKAPQNGGAQKSGGESTQAKAAPNRSAKDPVPSLVARLETLFSDGEYGTSDLEGYV